MITQSWKEFKISSHKFHYSKHYNRFNYKNMKQEIPQILLEILSSFSPLNLSETNKNAKELLHIILSDSVQAINFVSAIEDEFDIEFDDDEISSEFFNNTETIESLIITHLTKKNNYSH